MNATDLTAELKRTAQQLGFQMCGACPAVTPTGITRFHEWLQAGYAGQMHYLGDRAEAYADPRHVMEGVRSLVMLAMVYRTRDPQSPAAGQARISRYAWGNVDYHDLIHERLKCLAAAVRELEPRAKVRGVVDTAPLLEREYAQLAGLGWVGKNTLLLNRELGSWFFLAALLTDVELQYDVPHTVDHCGSCRACLDACPTDAFPQPYVLDATRCISYLTIEHRGAIAEDLREPVGDWLFGCDICQDVCPWNNHTPASVESGFVPCEETNPIELGELFGMDDAAFRRRFRHTPLWRAKRRGILRNAAIVLGNQKNATAVAYLAQGLDDPEPLVRAACVWALGRNDDPSARQALRSRCEVETDGEVKEALREALGETLP